MNTPEHIWFGGNLMSLLYTDGWTLLETQMRPGHAPPLHVHHTEDEGIEIGQRGHGSAFDPGAGQRPVWPMSSAIVRTTCSRPSRAPANGATDSVPTPTSA